MRLGVKLPGPFWLSARLTGGRSRRRHSSVLAQLGWLLWHVLVLCVYVGAFVVIAAVALTAAGVMAIRRRRAAANLPEHPPV